MNAVKRVPFAVQIILLLVLSYLPVVTADQTVNPDGPLLLLFFDSVKSLPDYFQRLIQLGTLDLQPVRDLFLYLEVMLYDLLGINTTVFVNILIWTYSCLVIHKIIKTIAPEMSYTKSRLLIFIFAFHPLFSTSIVWGMAIKHLLALLFICLATLALIQGVRESQVRKILLCSVFFLCSLLSQPICIHWGLWAVIYAFFLSPSESRQPVKILLMTAVPVSLLMGLANFYYYQHSDVFLYVYNRKFLPSVEMGEKIMALGHYFIQLILPIERSFQYDQGSPKVFAGLAIFAVFVSLILKYRKKTEIWIWSLLGLGPIIMMSNTPFIISDTYLLIPGMVLLLVLIKSGVFEKMSEFSLKWTTVVLVFCFSLVNFQYSRVWTDLATFTRHNQETQPSCRNANTAALIEIENHGTIHPEVKNYLETNGCIKQTLSSVPKMRSNEVKFLSLVIFYDQTLSRDQKIYSLNNFALVDAYGKLVLASMYATLKDKEGVTSALKGLRRVDFVPDGWQVYNRIMALYLEPYCKEIANEHCLSLISGQTVEVKRLWI